MMKNMFECDLIFCKYRCICVDIGNILVGLLHSSLSHLNQRKTNFVSKSSWIYFSINKFKSVLTFLTVLLIIIYLVCRTLIRCFIRMPRPLRLTTRGWPWRHDVSFANASYTSAHVLKERGKDKQIWIN